MFRTRPPRPASWRRIAILVMTSLAAGVFAAAAETVTLPAAASIVGGAPFYSDVRAFNTSYTSDLTVTATYRCFIGNPCPPIPPDSNFVLGPRESRAFNDIVVSAFNTPDTAGGIEFELDGDPRQLVVTSRLYSISPLPTVGMFIPGMLDEQAHASTVLTSIRNRGPGAGFRTNSGAFNGGDSPVSMTFRIFDAAGLPRGGPVNRIVAAHSGVQVSSIFVVAGAAGFETDNAVITVEATGPVFSYAAVIDNATTDPMFVVGARDSAVTPTSSRTATSGPPSTRTATRTSTQTTFTATATSSATATAGTPTVTFTASQTRTPTLSPTAFTPSITPTSTRTLSPTITLTASPTSTASRTATNSRTPTATPTFTSSATPTPTATASLTPTFSPSLTPSRTPTASETPTPTLTSTLTATPSPTPNPNHIVFVGPSGGNSFVDSVSGTSTTTITAGTTVEWQWVTGLHSTTSGTCDAINCIPNGIWDSGQHVPPFTFTRTFSVGDTTFTYFCTAHGVVMQGLVIVLP